MIESQANTNELCRRYCKLLHRELAAVPQLRRRAIRDIRTSLEDYLEQTPTATWQDLIAAFGAPSHVAEQFLNSLDAKQIRREAKRYRWRRVLLYTVVGLTLAYVLFYCGRLAINRLTEPDYVVIGSAQIHEGPLPTSPPKP